MDDDLKPIAEKVDAGLRLSAADGLALLESPDVWTIGELADRVRRRMHGQTTYYNINRHLNYTNVCVLSCRFCAFFRKEGEQGTYEYTPEQVAAEARQATDAGATEIHIVGGLHPRLPFDYYIDMLKAIRLAAGQLHIKAFTAVEIMHLARIDGRPDDIAGILADLKDAGLGSLPGGGAEVLDPRVRNEVFKGKLRPDAWLGIHREAHKLGLMTTATILYGHVESLIERVNHLCLLRQAQDHAIDGNLPGRFQTVIPLPFVPDGSALQHLPGPTGLDNLKMLAVCRLMLDNFDHVKAFWIMQTLPLTQLALHFGVDDVDGTVVWYDITKVGTDSTHQEVTVADLCRTARQAGFDPVERDTLYRRVVRNGAAWSVSTP